MWTEAPASTAGYHPEALELHVFVPQADGEHRSFVQEDDGLTFAALDGARYRTTFTLNRRRSRIEVSAEVDGDGYQEFSRRSFLLVVHGAEPGTVRVDGVELERDGERFVLPNAGTGFRAEFATGR